MKRLLIIQEDSPYFLFETIQILEKNKIQLKDFKLTLLANKSSIDTLTEQSIVTSFHVITDVKDIVTSEFDMSINLSHNEVAWRNHSLIQSQFKIGPYYEENRLIVKDNWSSFYLTIKDKAPFLAFHLQDIFKNIIGIKSYEASIPQIRNIKTIAFGFSHSNLLSGAELESLVMEINTNFPHIAIMDITEVDPIQDLSSVLYIGPASLDALYLCESGAVGIFLTSQFQGFNLLPYGEGHIVLSSRNKPFHAQELGNLVISFLLHQDLPATQYSCYKLTSEHLFGTYLQSVNQSDENYPIYQSHVVLWNFVLGLFDINLEITKCSLRQKEVLMEQLHVLTKLNRLYDYAMSSIDTILKEVKGPFNQDIIQGHLKNLAEIDGISDQISQSHPYLRQILDFYYIRRGQNEGNTLLEQSEHSFLVYSEEQQSLKALEELFSVTLNKNEANI